MDAQMDEQTQKAEQMRNISHSLKLFRDPSRMRTFFADPEQTRMYVFYELEHRVAYVKGPGLRKQNIQNAGKTNYSNFAALAIVYLSSNGEFNDGKFHPPSESRLMQKIDIDDKGLLYIELTPFGVNEFKKYREYDGEYKKNNASLSKLMANYDLTKKRTGLVGLIAKDHSGPSILAQNTFESAGRADGSVKDDFVVGKRNSLRNYRSK